MPDPSAALVQSPVQTSQGRAGATNDGAGRKVRETDAIPPLFDVAATNGWSRERDLVRGDRS